MKYLYDSRFSKMYYTIICGRKVKFLSPQRDRKKRKNIG